MQIGQIMYITPLPWRTDESVAGIMLAPVLFAMLTLLSTVILLALYLILQVFVAYVSQDNGRADLFAMLTWLFT
jgi:hypothetical protein